MYVHASILDGCENANTVFFKHNDVYSLQRVLANADKTHRNKIVVVDGVYSMDGDICRLDEIIEIAHAYNALVMVDEAHATGVIGRNGRGTPEHFGVEGKVDIISGTFSKGLGGVGGFVAGSKALVNYLEFMTRSYMFSTAPAPSVSGSLIKAIEVVETDAGRRAKLWQNIRFFREGLIARGFQIGPGGNCHFSAHYWRCL